MNKFNINSATFYFLMFALIINFTSCEETIYRPSEAYPDQLIYMPAAYGGYNGVYIIDNVTDYLGNETPVPGALAKYIVDLENRKFIVPLAVYRSGINNDGNVNVNITAVADSVSSFNASSDFTDELTLIPASEYVLPASVTVNNGDDVAQFNLLIDLDFLLAGYDTENYAISVNVSSPDREANEDLATTTVVVYSKILKATAAFVASVNNTTGELRLRNQSTYAVGYSWDFGDGSEISEEELPTHTYTTSGTYTITLKAIGIAGDVSNSVISKTITFN